MLALDEPKAAGMSSARLGRIRPAMQKYVDEGKLAGLITLIARHGKTIHLECIGMRDAEANKPMQPDTIFRIASMTKPISCSAAMMLYEEGRFQLNDPVSMFIPAFKDLKVLVKATETSLELTELEREPTMHDLLTHTSGLSYGRGEHPKVEEVYRRTNSPKPTTLRELTDVVVTLPLLNQPGRAWRYGLSHDVLARVVEIISDMPYDQYLQRRVFEPLGMKDTAYDVPEQKVDRLAALYAPAANGRYTRVQTGSSENTYPQLPSGGGGLFCTVADYLQFAQMLLNGGELDGARMLSRKTVELMTTNHLSPAVLSTFDAVTLSQGYYTKGYGYGLGVRVLMNPAENEILGSPGNYGWSGAYNTYFWIDHKEELIGFIWTQCQQVYYYPIERQFMVLAYQALTD